MCSLKFRVFFFLIGAHITENVVFENKLHFKSLAIKYFSIMYFWLLTLSKACLKVDTCLTFFFVHNCLLD